MNICKKKWIFTSLYMSMRDFLICLDNVCVFPLEEWLCKIMYSSANERSDSGLGFYNIPYRNYTLPTALPGTYLIHSYPSDRSLLLPPLAPPKPTPSPCSFVSKTHSLEIYPSIQYSLESASSSGWGEGGNAGWIPFHQEVLQIHIHFWSGSGSSILGWILIRIANPDPGFRWPKI